MIHVSDTKDEPDRFSSFRASRFVVVRIDANSNEEEEAMALNKKKGLHELLTDKAKGQAPKDALGSQPSLALPPPPPPTINPFTVANLKKKRKEKEMAEKEELVP